MKISLETPCITIDAPINSLLLKNDKDELIGKVIEYDTKTRIARTFDDESIPVKIVEIKFCIPSEQFPEYLNAHQICGNRNKKES